MDLFYSFYFPNSSDHNAVHICSSKVHISSGAKGTERACTDNWPIIVIFDTNVKMQSIK